MRNLIVALVIIGSLHDVHAERRKDLRDYVLKAVQELAKHHANEGYSAGAYFTHDLDYAEKEQIKASALKPKTMCVAAVTEVLVTALQLYAEAEHDPSVYEKLPPRTWMKTSRNDIRPYIFMFDTVRSDGTADALERFGIGEQIPFAELLPGDFVNLNREKTGHAVVFLGFLDRNGDLVERYDAKAVVGFKYFSSQGKANGGFGYRWAYFDDHCPAKPVPDKPRDCGVIWSPRQHILNTGYLLHPSLWRVEDANDERRRDQFNAMLDKRFGVGRKPDAFGNLAPTRQRQFERQLETEMNRPLPGAPLKTYTGETTDE